MAHAEIPSCADCKTWDYDRTWKRTKTKRGGTLEDRKRTPGAPTPCWTCPKADDGKPAPHKELTAKNWRAWEYYWQCEVDATGLLPRDRLTIRNNALIRGLLDQIARERQNLAPVLLALAGVSMRGR